MYTSRSGTLNSGATDMVFDSKEEFDKCISLLEGHTIKDTCCSKDMGTIIRLMRDNYNSSDISYRGKPSTSLPDYCSQELLNVIFYILKES